MRVFVTGATGLLGSHVVPACVEAGHDLTCLVRPDAPVPPSLEGRRLHRGTLPDLDPSSLCGCDAVVHAASLTPSRGDRPEMRGGYRRVNVEGTAALLTACQAAGARRFVYISTAAVLFEWRRNAYSLSKLDAEELVSRGPTPWVILRPAEIYGPGRVWDTLRQQLLRRRLLFVRRGVPRMIQPVYVGDVAAAVVSALQSDSAGHRYAIAGREAVTYERFLREVRAAIGARYAILPIPEWVVKAATTLGGWAPDRIRARITAFAGASRSSACDIQPAVAELGYAPRALDEWLALLR